MEATRHSPSVEECEDPNQQHDDIIRQEYEVRLGGGHKSVIPSACELPLAYTHKPDYSMALDMPGGVSDAFIVIVHKFMIKTFNFLIGPDSESDLESDSVPTPLISFLAGKHKKVV